MLLSIVGYAEEHHLHMAPLWYARGFVKGRWVDVEIWGSTCWQGLCLDYFYRLWPCVHCCCVRVSAAPYTARAVEEVTLLPVFGDAVNDYVGRMVWIPKKTLVVQNAWQEMWSSAVSCVKC